MSELAKHFASKKDLEVHLVLFGRSREIFYNIPESIKIHSPEWEFNNNLRILFTLRTLLWLRMKIKSIEPDKVISFGEYWNSFVLLALKWTDYPVYISDRCKPDKQLGKLHEVLRKWLYPYAAGIIAQTGKARDVYLRKGLNVNIKVIGNPIREISSKGIQVEKENLILTVGRLIDTKHHDRLIDIYYQKIGKDWKLVIVGDNALKQDGKSRLLEIIAEKGLHERVILTGTVSNVEEYYLKSKIFAFTSSSEGFPNVIGEAMAAGLPVVAYDCVAGPSEMIENGKNGFLIPLFNDKEFSLKLKQLTSDEFLRKRLGSEAKKSIKRYSVDSIGDKFLNFILGENETAAD